MSMRTRTDSRDQMANAATSTAEKTTNAAVALTHPDEPKASAGSAADVPAPAARAIEKQGRGSSDVAVRDDRTI